LNQYESGLVIPVVKNADRKSLIKISKSIRDLVEKARNRKLMPDDLSDGTFTLTKHGVFAVGESWTTPIINQPQSAIMGTGGIVEKPVVKNGQISIRPVMNFTLTHDHRIIDGAPSVRFMARVQELMENPVLLVVGEE
jgi:pyruvate dehydrogenase E2 component (dihydrolipoamide acetyltransferase)